MQKEKMEKAPYSKLTPKERKIQKEYYTYRYERKKNDINGNPRHYATVYRIKKNIPILIAEKLDIGYRDNNQAIEDLIDEENGWKENYSYGSGYTEGKARRLRRLGKIIIHQV